MKMWIIIDGPSKHGVSIRNTCKDGLGTHSSGCDGGPKRKSRLLEVRSIAA